jgi:hypothetical protein
MLGDVEVDDPPAMVGKHHEDEQDAEARGGHGEEIDGDHSLVDGELLAQGEVLQGQLAMAAEEDGEEPQQVEQQGDHQAEIGLRSASDQPLSAGPGFGERQPADVTGHRRQLDARIFEHLLEPIGLAGMLADQRGAVAREISELADRCWRQSFPARAHAPAVAQSRRPSLTSVFRPGTCAALASTHVNASSST